MRRDGCIYLYRNSCPHLGVELNWSGDEFMSPDGLWLQCAAHGALFEIDSGLCVAGPCHGKSLTPIPFVLEDGQLAALLPPHSP